MTSYSMIAAWDKITQLREATDGGLHISVPRAGGQWWIELRREDGSNLLFTGSTLGEAADKFEYQLLSEAARE